MAQVSDGDWSPQIAIGTAVMIPEGYVPDLHLRLALYRRLADLDSPEVRRHVTCTVSRCGLRLNRWRCL